MTTLEYIENRIKSLQYYYNHDSIWYHTDLREINTRLAELYNLRDMIKENVLKEAK